MKKIFTHIKVKGIKASVDSIKQRLFPRPFPEFERTKGIYMGSRVLEIGDSSPSFMQNGVFPIYPVVGELDNLKKSDSTEWTPAAPQIKGKVILDCGVSCSSISDASYDGTISSHVLEHMANPLKALKNWNRITKPGGYVVLLLPRKTHIFDHKRPTTTFNHLLTDYTTDTQETDNTHVEEFVRCFDENMDLGNIHSRSDIVRLAVRHYENGVIHHHTWDDILTAEVVTWAGFKVIEIGYYPPFHIVCVGVKQS